ncbi:uncharacterized protein METZ01_LOCUS127434 [marine metagenome]|uniref:Sulfatase N-terminal domain-containing protein n=1 Tax=marine metagenome TaxID=408172 RepID=A0A381YCI0_9ZZZZ
MTSQPNIVLIMVDNQSAFTLGCYGNEEIYTPNIDAMAERGLRFTEAYCPNAMCSPGRASALTGLMPSGHGVHTWLDDRLRDNWPRNWSAIDEFQNLPAQLKAAGYHTGLSGKYHLGHADQPKNDFDFWVALPFGHTRNFYRNTIYDNGESRVVASHSVDFFAERASDFICLQERDGPFFLFVTPNGPYGHWPAIKGPCGTRHQARYENCPVNSVPREGLNQAAIEHHVLIRGDTAEGGPDYGSILRLPNDTVALRNYFAQCSVIDDLVGTVIRSLDDTGLADNTLLIFTADHGFSLGQHGFWGHGLATWPSNAHRCAYNIPLIATWPGVIRPHANDALVSSTDLYQTVLQAAQLAPATGRANVSSRSLMPLFDGSDENWDNVIYIEQEETRAIRTPEWLFVKRFPCESWPSLKDELYNLSSDPDERINLAEEEAYAEIVASLSMRVDRFFSEAAQDDYDLWSGGSPKSNTARPWLWPGVWGKDWKPHHG